MLKELIPLNEIDNEGIEVDLKLPEFLTAKIGIDIERLVTLCRIVGVTGLKINTFKSDQDDLGAVGSVDAHGQATASMVSMQRNPLNKANSKYRNRTPIKLAREYMGEMSLDVNEILKIVAANSELGMRDFEKIADILDGELKTAMVKMAYQCSLMDTSLFERFVTLYILFLYLANIFSGGIGSCWFLLTVHVVANVVGMLAAKIGGENFRPGFGAMGMEIDRFILLAVRANTGKLVGAVYEDFS